MVLFKACSRWSGDLRETTNIYGRYLSCTQGCHARDLPDVRFDVTLAGHPGAEDVAA